MAFYLDASAILPALVTESRSADIYVRRFELKLRTPDALHAAICRRTGSTLVTLDQRLADAAGELGTACHIPGQ